VLGGAGAVQDGTSAAFTGTAYMNTGTWAVSGTVYSVECWFKAAAAANMVLLDQRYPNAFGEIELQVTASGFIEWITWDSSYAFDLVGSVNLCNNVWHHVVATRNGATATVYVDGVQVLQTTSGSATIAAATPPHVLLGRDIRDGGRQLVGSLDEVAVYNGVALSAARALAHYNSGLGLSSGTAGWVTLDSGLDVPVSAFAGDVVEVGLSALVEPGVGDVFFDAASLVGGAPVGYWGASGGSTDYGVSGWATAGSGMDSPVLRRVTAGDLASGVLTVRLLTRTTGPRTIDATAGRPLQFWAKNHGPQEA
jgi:hypothetical protein